MTEQYFHSDSNTRRQSRSRDTLSTGEKVTEFESVDELLQYDRDQIDVPPGIKQKVARTLPASATKPTPWWRRLFR